MKTTTDIAQLCSSESNGDVLRRADKHLDAGGKIGRSPTIAKKSQPFSQSNFKGVIARQAVFQTIPQRLAGRRLGERSKYPVEHDQRRAIVFVEACFVRGVVHPVVSWAVQNPFKRSEPHVISGMQKELVEKT